MSFFVLCPTEEWWSWYNIGLFWNWVRSSVPIRLSNVIGGCLSDFCTNHSEFSEHSRFVWKFTVDVRGKVRVAKHWAIVSRSENYKLCTKFIHKETRVYKYVVYIHMPQTYTSTYTLLHNTNSTNLYSLWSSIERFHTMSLIPSFNSVRIHTVRSLNFCTVLPRRMVAAEKNSAHLRHAENIRTRRSSRANTPPRISRKTVAIERRLTCRRRQ